MAPHCRHSVGSAALHDRATRRAAARKPLIGAGLIEINARVADLAQALR